MSDINDAQDTTVTESVDFADSLELEPETQSAPDTTTETTEPSTVEETPAETPAEDTPVEPTKQESAPEEPADTSQDGQPEIKSKEEIKEMSRAEKAAYYQSLERSTQQQVQQSVNEVYAPQPVDELQQYYLNQGYSDGEALMLARQDVAEQKVQIAEATTQITQLNANLQVDAFEARSKFEWMNPDSDKFDKETAQIAANLFETGLTTDPRTGQIVDSKLTPMQVATMINTIRNSGSSQAALAAQKAAEQQLAAVAPQTSTKPVENKSTEDKQAQALIDAFNTV